MKLDWKTCFKVGLSILILYICIRYFDKANTLFLTILGAASPLLIGCALAYLVNLPMSFYERHYFPNAKNVILVKSRRPVCLIMALLTFGIIISLIVSIILPQLISCVQLIFNAVAEATQYVMSYATQTHLIPQDVLNSLAEIDWESFISKAVDAFSEGIGNVITFLFETVTYIFSAIVTAIVSVMFAFYLLASKDKLKIHCEKLMKRYMHKKVYEKTNHILAVLNDSFHDYIVGQCIEAVILGVLCTIGMVCLGLPHAPTIGVLIAFTALIPIAGAYIGAIIGAFIILTVSPIQALVFLAFIIILQQFEGNLIYPKVVGTSLGLPGIWVLAAVTIGGGMFGVLGMLFGVPLAATAYRLIREDVNRPPRKFRRQRQPVHNAHTPNENASAQSVPEKHQKES